MTFEKEKYWHIQEIGLTLLAIANIKQILGSVASTSMDNDKVGGFFYKVSKVRILVIARRQHLC